MIKELVAVVLAGGSGSRFWPFHTHKIVFPYLGRKFFDLTIAEALPRQVSRVVLVTNSENKETLARVKFPVPRVVVVQKNPLGMADALLSAASELAGCRFLVLIADDVMDKAVLQQVITRAQTRNVFGVIPGWKTDTYFPGGYLRLADGHIKGIIEKPQEGQKPSPYVAISGHYFANSDVFFEAMKETKSQKDDLYEQTLARLMTHENFEMVPYEGAFMSLKYPWHVLDVMDYFLKTRIRNHRGNHVEIRDSVTIEGDVYIEDGVKIFEHTKIVGPCFIGKDTIIGNNNLIRHSHIGARCVTGFNTDITRSYIGDDSWFHTNYVGDSVIEGNISMGSGSVLANIRLDEGDIYSSVKKERVNTHRQRLGALVATGVRIGVNASIMPGVKIGKGSFVGAGVVLDRDIGEQSFCIAGGGMTIERNTKAVSPRDATQFRY